MNGSGLPDELVLAHQLVGYTTAFFIAPLALLAFADPQRHRGWAKTYLYLMIPLYLTGLFFTFERHAVGSFVWARNLAFNFVGFYFVLLGWRAISRFRRQAVEPTLLDHAMRALLVAASAALVAMGGLHHFPSFVFGALGLWLGVFVFREPQEVRALYPCGSRDVRDRDSGRCVHRRRRDGAYSEARTDCAARAGMNDALERGEPARERVAVFVEFLDVVVTRAVNPDDRTVRCYREKALAVIGGDQRVALAMDEQHRRPDRAHIDIRRERVAQQRRRGPWKVDARKVRRAPER